MWKKFIGAMVLSAAIVTGLQTSAQADERTDIFNEINSMRSTKLKVDPVAQKVAQERANWLANRNKGFPLPAITNAFPQKPVGFVFPGRQLQSASSRTADPIEIFGNLKAGSKSTLVSKTYTHGGVGVSSDSNGVTYVVVNLAQIKKPTTYSTTTPKPTTQKPQNQSSGGTNAGTTQNSGSTSTGSQNGSQALQAELDAAKKAAQKLKEEKEQDAKDAAAKLIKDKKAQADRDKAAKDKADKEKLDRDAQDAREKADREAKEKLLAAERDADKAEAKRVKDEADQKALTAAGEVEKASAQEKQVKQVVKTIAMSGAFGFGGLSLVSFARIPFSRKKRLNVPPDQP